MEGATTPLATCRGGRRAPRRVLFVVNVDWFFLSHRLPLARAARAEGYEVTVAARDTGCADEIRREGLDFIPLPISRDGRSLREEATAIRFLWRLYRRLRPDLVHHVTIKPVLYGSLVARLVPGLAVVNAISGLGYVFSGDQNAGALRRLVEPAFRMVLHHPRSRTIFQNPEDRDRFVEARLIPAHQTVLIRGSGVDLRRFHVEPEPPGTPVVLLPSRMLWEKGVGVLVDAARLLRDRGVQARFALVGMLDPYNPGGVPREQIEAWVREGVVEWWGHQADMPATLSRSSIVALPTYYREGLPKALLEAAACGRPLIATDIPGCRDIVRHEVNGLLVAPHDVEGFAAAVERLLASPELRADFGRASRQIAETEFAEEIVVRQTMQLYRELLRDAPAGVDRLAS